MASCGSLQHIFEKPLPENQALLESLTSSWSQNIKPVEGTEAEQSSFSELFGELYFKDNSTPSLSASLPNPMPIDQYSISSKTSSQIAINDNEKQSKGLSFSFRFETNYASCNKSDNNVFSSMKSGSLQLCTEGLGTESSDDVEDLQGEVMNENWNIKEEKVVSCSTKHIAAETSSSEFRRSRMSRGAFPPPISFIGKSGVSGVCFKSYRQDGRFVLKEVRIPTQEFLQARREDGRLKLQIIQPNDDILEEDDEEEEEQDDVEDSSGKDDEENDVGHVRDNDEA